MTKSTSFSLALHWCSRPTTLSVCLIGVVIHAIALRWLVWPGHFHDSERSLWFAASLGIDAVCLLAVARTAGRTRIVWVASAGMFCALGVGYAKHVAKTRLAHDTIEVTSAMYRIESVVRQYFLGEQPDRVFVGYDDIVGPGRMIKALPSLEGEDYREIFPLRADWDTMEVTMGDGRKNLLVLEQFYQLSATGKLTARNPKILPPYRAFADAQKRRDGLEISPRPEGRRFETTWRQGVREGPFRAYYQTGELWAEATYVAGRPVGRHVVYDGAGKIIHETLFPTALRP